MKRTLSLLLVVVMLVGLFAGVSLHAAAADPITVEKELTLTACQELPGGRVDFFSDLEKYSRVSPIDSVEKGWYLELPRGMSWDFNEAREFYIKGTPTETGDFYARWNVTLEDGQRIVASRSGINSALISGQETVIGWTGEHAVEVIDDGV